MRPMQASFEATRVVALVAEPMHSASTISAGHEREYNHIYWYANRLSGLPSKLITIALANQSSNDLVA